MLEDNLGLCSWQNLGSEHFEEKSRGAGGENNISGARKRLRKTSANDEINEL